ncbi:MAG TPA: 8-oxoguanine deaminase [Actinomycetota bacterium]|nr:8-oxoguanine deaminase [Actinomycetota bacterium]
MTAGRVVIGGCAIATMDAADRELASGHIVIEGGRIAAIGEGDAPDAGGARIDASGCLATPGLVNCHHHLYQWLTRGLAQQTNLFEWLTALYPVWAHLDPDLEAAAARAGAVALALSGCSTTTDHHYVFPRGVDDLLEPSIEAVGEVGLRFHPCRGAMDLGRSGGGLPPDEITEPTDAVMAAIEAAIDRFHDPAFGAMVRIAVAPCSPFSVTADLMRESARLARARGVRLHTHLAETKEEEDFCVERFGVRPVEYLDGLEWLGDDVWLAHCIHLDDAEVGRFGATRTGVAHCPSSNARLGAGIAPAADLLRSGAAVGLGVDGAASNEAGELGPEMRAALLLARLRGGPRAMTARTALALATREGARCLGRSDEIGSLEEGKCADIALWRLDDLGRAGIADPVAALVLGPAQRADTLIVDGRTVVEGGHAARIDEDGVARDLDKASRRLVDAGEAS